MFEVGKKKKNLPGAYCLVGWVHDWLPRSSMTNGINSITSIASNQSRTICTTVVVIRTVDKRSVLMHRLSWQCWSKEKTTEQDGVKTHILYTYK
jgi:hypothetical protein